MTLSARLNLLIGGLLIIALVAMAALLFVRAMSRIQEEEKSMLRAAEFVLHAAAPRVQDSRNPDQEIAAILAELRGLKHISVRPIYARGSNGSPAHNVQDHFYHKLAKVLSGEDRDRIHSRIDLKNSRAEVAAIELSPNPVDEIEEIVVEISDILLISAIFSCFVFVITGMLVRHSLKPISDLQSAVSEMQSGNFNISLSREQSPEFTSISRALADLGKALGEAQQKSRKLASQLVSAQDLERKDIARELHDELGAYLFSIRARAASLQARMSDDTNSELFRQGEMDSLIAQLDSLQVALRHVLQRLVPPGLQELGLKKALQGMVEQWRAEHPDKEISAAIMVPDTLNETLRLTTYRIVQEGVTNALKHSKADRISIVVRKGNTANTNRAEVLQIRIVDNGGGLDREIIPGFGLRGMEERVLAIGGTLTISNDTSYGTCLEVSVDMRDDGMQMDSKSAMSDD